jgi:hypothetical protein
MLGIVPGIVHDIGKLRIFIQQPIENPVGMNVDRDQVQFVFWKHGQVPCMYRQGAVNGLEVRSASRQQYTVTIRRNSCCENIWDPDARSGIL